MGQTFNPIRLCFFCFRDKELEINQIEQERHCMREKRDGKHYLIESYLKGLPDISKNGN